MIKKIFPYLRLIYRIRWWLIIGSFFITLCAIYFTRDMKSTYNVDSSLYTGASGGDLMKGGNNVNWSYVDNTINKLVSIMKSESTLQRVAIHLYARCMIHGDPKNDNQYIKASNYNWMYHHLKASPHGNEILALIDKTNEEKTVKNLTKYMLPDKDNYIYGLFHYDHPYFSYTALQKMDINSEEGSDIIDVKYASDDPGITYNTVSILMEEFVNEYRSIRYGDTDKVIDFFKSELARIGSDLRDKEDDLTAYSIDKRVINYGEETKQVAIQNEEMEMREQEIMFSYNSSKAMLQEVEKNMDENARQLINNFQYVNKLKEASNLVGKISQMEAFPEGNKGKGSLQSYKDQLQSAKQDLSDITDRYIIQSHSKEGISKASFVNEWLQLTLQYEKAKSDLRVVQQNIRDMDNKYVFFAPVGVTINRKERAINFTERNYLSILSSYNDALMRKKDLEMTSATIKVINPPSFPLTSQPTGRKNIVIISFLTSFALIFIFFFLQELLDRTLRDPDRTKRLTRLNVLGAYPEKSSAKYRSYNKTCEDMAIRQFSSVLLRFCTNRKDNEPFIINFITTEIDNDIDGLTDKLLVYWRNLGLRSRKLSYNEDYDAQSSKYLLAKGISDFYNKGDEDILIVECPNITENNIPSPLLQEVNINLFIANANHGWTTTDDIKLKNLRKLVGNAPLFAYLNQASRDVVQEFAGMLPPYTLFRRQIYRFSQLAFTEKISSKPRRLDENSEFDNYDDIEEIDET